MKDRRQSKDRRKAVRERFELKRWQKNTVHFVILFVIMVSLTEEGGKLADWCFFALSVVCELN